MQLLVDRFGADMNTPKISPDGEEDHSVTPLVETAEEGHLRVMAHFENLGATVPVEEAEMLQPRLSKRAALSSLQTILLSKAPYHPTK